jgi:diamine N-acetyltransferase
MSDEEKIPRKDSVVSLREISKETVRSICNLTVDEHQNQFVAPNSVSIAQAYFEPKAWFRAIYADEIPVGFVMLYDNSEENEYFLWRFMIDKKYQKLGFGKKALLLVIDYVKSRPNAKELYTSYVKKDGSPEGFYKQLGFVDTGKIDHGEHVLKLTLD